MSDSKRVLLMTNSEYGQANVHLAVAHALLQQDDHVEVHIASFRPLRKSVLGISDLACRDAPGARPIAFHELPGATMFDALVRPRFNYFEKARKPLNFWTTLQNTKIICHVACGPWDADESVRIFRRTLEIIAEVEPDIIAIDNFLAPSLSACQHFRLRYLVLSPNTLKDFSLMFQPNMPFLWRFPAFATGYPFPLPWHLIPANMFFNLLYVMIFLSVFSFDVRTRKIKKALYDQFGAKRTSCFSLFRDPPDSVQILCANRIEIEMQPLELPPHVIPCGPILCPSPPVVAVDPGLFEWLSQGPTVMINLGTHVRWSEALTIEMTSALRYLLDRVSNDPSLSKLQILWKLKPDPDQDFDVAPGSKIYEKLEKEINQGRVKIESWLKATPYSILETGQIILSINHAGASSFYECLWFGVPQVLLPQWFDCYDFAERAEFLGIGVHGCRKSQPHWTSGELGPKLELALRGSKAIEMRKKAAELVSLCKGNEKGTGRDVAARHILSKIKTGEKRQSIVREEGSIVDRQ
ncbi:glycosyltransferase family 1 protein [Biscogniauxia marginata]|nr:glycosyltransferase family 1 protein [Biscogniauxia marginata]